jgi:hypothetical protein
LVFGYNSDLGITGRYSPKEYRRQPSDKTGRLITLYAKTYQGKFGNKRRANV